MKTRTWIKAHPYWTLTLAVVLALAPFLGKPFNMDDPLFIWTARQIQSHPLNPYGFDVNWYGSPSPMWHVTQNPPLGSYYMAVAGSIFGWSEWALHGAFLFPAIAAILGAYRLARRLCQRPMLAALITLLTPVFLVSGTTVMCDVLMLAFWIWAAVFWLEGLEQKSRARLVAAGVLTALAGLTKYYGLCLVPLLAVYSLTVKSRPRGWAAALIIPVAAVCAWEWATLALYGHALLGDAAAYAGSAGHTAAAPRSVTLLTALSFTGGCLAPATFLMPLSWRPRLLLVFAGAMAAAALAIFFGGPFEHFLAWLPEKTRASMQFQAFFWSVGGLSILALAVAEVVKHRDGAAWLLALWALGTFFFTGMFNWTVNGRSILPMAPAVGILLARRLADVNWKRLAPPVAAGAALALAVAYADALNAVSARQTARQIHQMRKDGPLSFEGHWGFQYYMSQLGEAQKDLSKPVAPGDVVAVPLDNTDVAYPDWPHRRVIGGGPHWLTDMNMYVGAGFYSSLAGIAPFVFGDAPAEDVMLFENIPIKKDVSGGNSRQPVRP